MPDPYDSYPGYFPRSGTEQNASRSFIWKSESVKAIHFYWIFRPFQGPDEADKIANAEGEGGAREIRQAHEEV